MSKAHVTCGTGTPAGACFLSEGRFGTGKSTSTPPGEALGRDPGACATQAWRRNERCPLHWLDGFEKMTLS